jgi:hypothetical protein
LLDVQEFAQKLEIDQAALQTAAKATADTATATVSNTQRIILLYRGGGIRHISLLLSLCIHFGNSREAKSTSGGMNIVVHYRLHETFHSHT